MEAAPSSVCGFIAGGKQHLAFCFSFKSKCWITERKKKNKNQSRFVTRITKACSWRCRRALQQRVGGLSICILNELGGSATVSQRTSASTFGKQEREARRGGDKGLSSDWTIQSSGSRQSARLVKVNDHDVHFACQTRRRWETRRFWNFALMREQRRLWRVLN